ncbi:MAG: response regulator [Marinagarivorans sp.]|nr:response regulator [Marinagarivorans sp.]
MAIKILVADDATFVRDMIKRSLRNMAVGIDITEAQDGAKARSLIKQKIPDLILSDWEMPNVSGEELLKWVRETPETSQIPFIMITSRGDREHVMAAVQAGVNDYISKPFTPEELIRKVTKQLNRVGIKLGVAASNAATSGFGSLEVLTSTQTAPTTQREAPAPTPSASRTATVVAFKGKASLRFAGDEPRDCIVREISLQSLGGFLVRSQKSPTVFDQAVVDLCDEQGELIATLNAYVHSVQAVEPTPSSRGIKVVVRFVDKDPAKLEALSRHL